MDGDKYWCDFIIENKLSQVILFDMKHTETREYFPSSNNG